MTERMAWGHGLATVTDGGTVLDTWYPAPALGARPDDDQVPPSLAAAAGHDEARGVTVEPVVTQIAVVSYCLPIVAVGGIAIVILGGAKKPGDPSATAIFLAALAVFFTTVVGALLGFKAADRASLDVVRVYGGNRWTQLVKVRLVAALPAILNALQVAVPTAFLGAVLGEYMGATDRSVGITLIRLQGDLDSVRVWAVFLLCAVVALVGYGLVGLVARLVTPWVSGREHA